MEQRRADFRRGRQFVVRRLGPLGRISRDQKHTRLVVLTLILTVVLGVPSVAKAAIRTYDFASSATTVGNPLIRAYAYQSGESWSLSNPAEFGLGDYGANTTQELTNQAGAALNTLTLQPLGPAGTAGPNTSDALWWNTEWNLRDCHVIDHRAAGAESVTEYQVRLDFDVEELISEGYLQSNTGDLRAVAADGSTQLPVWVDSTRDAVWVQVDSIAAAQVQTVCLYYAHQDGDRAPLANHTAEAVFSYSSPKDIYYAVGDVYDGLSSIEVAAYLDGTEFSSGGDLFSLDAGDLVTVDAVTQSSISTTGPLTSRGVSAGFESLVPISWAGRSFVIPATRGDEQRLNFFAPFGDTTVEIFSGTDAAPRATLAITTETATWTELAGDPVGDEAIVVTADRPILVFHDSTTNEDSFIAVPFLDTEWFGVGSDQTYFGSSLNGTHVDEDRSDVATSVSHALNRGEVVQAANGGQDGGAANAGVRLTLDTSATPDPEISPQNAEFFAIGQSDGDGFEATSFQPASELNSAYLIPTMSQYVAFSCPTAGTQITITPASLPATTHTCAGPGTVGTVQDTRVLTPIPSVTALGITTPGRATMVQSVNDEPFFVYYEDASTDGETNVIGMKQGRQYTWPEPVVTSRSEGLFPSEGTWLSHDLALGAGSGVFGTVDFDEISDADTSVEIKLASGVSPGPNTFVGPDGTDATFFASTSPQAADFAHDGDAFARMQVRLLTTDRTKTPQLVSLTATYNLPLVQRQLGVPTALTATSGVSPATTSVHLLRIKTNSTDLAASTLGVSLTGIDPTVAVLQVRLINASVSVNSAQADLAGGTFNPVSFSPGLSYSLVVESALPTPSTAATVSGDVRIDIGGSGVIAATDFAIGLSTP